MRFLPTRIHGMLDYGLGIVLILSPYLLGFADNGAATWVPTIVGAGLLVLSATTDYELGMTRLVPMNIHLGADIAAGALLILSPWLFGFADAVWLPHVVFGALEVGTGLTTRTVPDDVGGLAPSRILGGTAAERRAKPIPDAPRSSDLRPATGSAENPDQLRRAIDSGKTRDKVAVVDPAAAPLGTDAEAGAEPDDRGLKIAREQGRGGPAPSGRLPG